MHRVEVCWKRQEERILVECQAETKGHHEFQAGYDRRTLLLKLSEKNLTALKLKNFNDEINSFFMDSYCSKIWNYGKLMTSFGEMEELQKFQSSTVESSARRRLVGTLFSNLLAEYRICKGKQIV